MRSKHLISSVGAEAYDAGVLEGDALLAIDGEEVIDTVDYLDLTAKEHLTLTLDRGGREITIEIKKEIHEPLGIEFADNPMGALRTCHNKCVFCFIDQTPKCGRDTLHVKDDDWRMSFVMGNYVTLTNVDDEEFNRIIKRRTSPLFVSVHATNASVRSRMMNNATAGNILARLRALKAANIAFHAQIVCCPGINDGSILEETMNDLLELEVKSVSIVPVGLTKFRDKLTKLRPFTAEEASSTIAQIEACQLRALEKTGSRMMFASDEMYIIAGKELPPYEAYEDFPQIENGVGLLRLYEDEFLYGLEDKKPLEQKRSFAIVSGVAASAFFVKLYEKLEQLNVKLTPYVVKNDFFGESIHVGGLLTGTDIVKSLKDNITEDTLFIPGNMLRETEDVFLDGMSVSDVKDALGINVIALRGGGDELARALFRHYENSIF